MGDGNKFRGKFTSSGFNKSKGMSFSGSSSGGFPSFRFSPENEEIEEILQGDSTLAAGSGIHDERQSESLPESPKPSTGDTSPIKDYLRKNWANKWDKKSLSLDLDLKEKIIAAIEDKRKSIVSHFIPEETAGLIIPTSSSGFNSSCPVVTEHTGIVVAGESTINTNSTVSNTNNNAILFDNATQKVSANISHSQSTGDNSSTTSDEFEEIGLDYLANMATAEQMDDAVLDLILPFTFGADKLQDLYGDSPMLHAPVPREDSRHHREREFSDDDDEELQFSNVLKNMVTAVVLHEWTKYLLALVGAAMFISFNAFMSGIFWFIMGVVVTVILTQSLMESPTFSTCRRKESLVNILDVTAYSGELMVPPAIEIFQKPQKSQGWMTEFEGDYDPFTNHIRLNRIVFVRLEGSSLYISYPHGKHGIPKRRLWSDPPLSVDITFSRHTVYNISGSQVFIAPERLARRRAWNKKYPIGIRLPKYSLVSIVSPTEQFKTGHATTGEGNPTTLSSSSPTIVAQSEPVAQQTDQSQSHKYRKGNKNIAREDVGDKILYLFSRTDREKDDWYRRFATAALRKDSAYGTKSTPKEDINLQKQYMSYMRSVIPALNEFKESERKEAAQKPTQLPIEVIPTIQKKHAVLPKKTENKGKEEVTTAFPSTTKTPAPQPTPIEIEKILNIPQSPVFLNALLGRIFFDFLRSPHWANQIQTLIQKKLNYIKRPQFLDVLLVRDLDLGRSIPFIQRASSPVIDSQGLWVDLDITYEGNMVVTLETKLNLMKLRKSPTSEDEPIHVNIPSAPGRTNILNASPADGSGAHDENAASTPHGANMFDSDADDSGESSEEEEYDPDDFISQHPQDTTLSDVPPSSGSDNSVTKPSKGAKILRMAEKIANSNFVTEMKVVKKAIANVANTPLVLSVELKSCVGTLALNIPSPPTDRLWYGFRTNPNMKIIAKPKFGERAVNLTHVTEWIRKKLLHEFQRVAVLPNMDDINIPLMEFKLPTS